MHCLLTPYHGGHNGPGESTIHAVTNCTLLDIKPLSRMCTVCTKENIAAVVSRVDENREMSILRRSQQFGLMIYHNV